MSRPVKLYNPNIIHPKHRLTDCKFHSTVFVGLQIINSALCIQNRRLALPWVQHGFRRLSNAIALPEPVFNFQD